MEKRFIGKKALERFKAEQDELNSKQFLSLDENGIAKKEQLPDLVNVMEIYVDRSNPDDFKFYVYDETNGYTEFVGKRKTIYVDSGSNKIYRWNGSNFILMGDKVSLAQNAAFDVDGNRIDTFYVKKVDLQNVKAPLINAATKENLGVVKIGNNLSCDEKGTISFSKENVIDALGYEPSNPDDVIEVTDEDIDKMFSSD